jgi:hypothetical protein
VAATPDPIGVAALADDGPGTHPDPGITAAACLVRSGHRDNALAIVAESLAGKLTAPARSRLVALQAWMLG